MTLPKLANKKHPLASVQDGDLTLLILTLFFRLDAVRYNSLKQ
jgi:hypothetical protein